MEDLHFRFTTSSDSWETLSSLPDSAASINVSLNEAMGMSFADMSYTRCIPAMRYSTFVSDASLDNGISGNFIVVREGNELRLRPYGSLGLSKLESFMHSDSLSESSLYYYIGPNGMNYLTKGNEIIYGMFRSNSLPQITDYDDDSFIDWREYVHNIHSAYVNGQAISYFTLSYDVNLSTPSCRAFIGEAGVYYESDLLGDLIKLGADSLLNGLCVKSADGFNLSDMSMISAGLGSLKISSHSSTNSYVVYGNINFEGDYQSLNIDGLVTGSREVKVLDGYSHDAIRVFDTHVNMESDVTLNDASRAIHELSTSNEGIESCNTVRIKSISKDRSKYESSIYTIVKDFMAGYNAITGKCICMTIEEEVPIEVIGMPMYVNAQSMNIVGFWKESDTYSRCISDGLKQFASISKDSVPIINWNPQYEYTQNSTTYATLHAAEAAKRSEHDVVIFTGATNKYMVMNVTTPASVIRRTSCFYLASERTKGTSYISWNRGITTDASAYFTYDEMPIKIKYDAAKMSHLKSNCITNYVGVDEMLIVAFVKIDSNANSELYTEDSYWHWHYAHARQDIHELDPTVSRDGNYSSMSQNTINYTDTGKNTIYYWIPQNGASSSRNTALIRDHWYALFETYSPETSTASPHVEILDICYPDTNDVCEEFIPYMNASYTTRSCEKQGSTFRFTITVDGMLHSFTIDEDEFSKYFNMTIDEEGYITEISLSNKTGLIADYGDSCLYAPEIDVCIDIDAHSEVKYIYNNQRKICIPEFSGCTFIPC